MNNLFIPSELENRLIARIQSYHRGEFALIRMTSTMLLKSIIDASFSIRSILKEGGVVDFSKIEQGKENKIYSESVMLSGNKVEVAKTSFYRPNTKEGDPRFWIYGFKNFVSESNLVYLSVFQGKLVVVPIIENEDFEHGLKEFFGEYKLPEKILERLRLKLGQVVSRGWIESVSAKKNKSDKDVGDTLEAALGQKVNNIQQADFEGEIELKTKRAKSKTQDTLFAQVPSRWDHQDLNSVKDFIYKYGYKSDKHPGSPACMYVTVSNKPNPQGLYMLPDNESSHLFQYFKNNEEEHPVCSWTYEKLKNRLWEKHPATVWILAEEQEIDGKNHFRYFDFELTFKPVFSQFISLIGKGVVTYDWRGRVKDNGTGVRDHGHPFRIDPSKRDLLFGESRKIMVN